LKHRVRRNVLHRIDVPRLAHAVAGYPYVGHVWIMVGVDCCDTDTPGYSLLDVV